MPPSTRLEEGRNAVNRLRRVAGQMGGGGTHIQLWVDREARAITDCFGTTNPGSTGDAVGGTQTSSCPVGE